MHAAKLQVNQFNSWGSGPACLPPPSLSPSASCSVIWAVLLMGSSSNCYSGVVSDRSGANSKMAWGREKVWDHITEKDALENALCAPHQPFDASQVPSWTAAAAQIDHSGSLQEKRGCSGWILLTYLHFSYLQGSLDSCTSSNHTFSHREGNY